MPKVNFRPAAQPSFGLISDHIQIQQTVCKSSKPTESLSPQRRLQSALGQRFVRMISMMEELAHYKLDEEKTLDCQVYDDSLMVNMDQNELVYSITPSEHVQDVEKRIQLNESHQQCTKPMKTKKKRKKRIVRTWKTSHATWNRNQPIECQPYERESSMRKLNLLESLRQIKPSEVLSRQPPPTRKLPEQKYEKTLTMETKTIEEESSVFMEEPDSYPSVELENYPSNEPETYPTSSPLPVQRMTIDLRFNFEAPEPPSPPLYRGSIDDEITPEDTVKEIEPSKPMKWNHTPIFITTEMALWFKKSGRFQLKEKKQLKDI